jgi:hypothetical protein
MLHAPFSNSHDEPASDYLSLLGHLHSVHAIFCRTRRSHDSLFVSTTFGLYSRSLESSLASITVEHAWWVFIRSGHMDLLHSFNRFSQHPQAKLCRCFCDCRRTCRHMTSSSSSLELWPQVASSPDSPEQLLPSPWPCQHGPAGLGEP